MKHSLERVHGSYSFSVLPFPHKNPCQSFLLWYPKSYNHKLMRRLSQNQWVILPITLKSGDREFLRTTHNTTAATLTTNTPTLKNSPSTAYDKREIPFSHMGCQGIFAIACKNRIPANIYEIISTSPAAGFHPFIRSYSDSLALAFIHETILWKSLCPQGRRGRE